MRAKTRVLGAVALALYGFPAGVTAAEAPPDPAVTPPRVGSPPTQGALSASSAPGAEPTPEARYGGARWSACRPGSSPCVRSGAARLLLTSLGVLAGAAAGGILFALGDRLAGGDPATWLVGTGTVAGAGALVGAVFGRLGGDAPGDPDRIRPQTLGLAATYSGSSVLDEADPATMSMTFAPTLGFPHDHGRLRLVGHFGGSLGSRADVDPRPQVEATTGGPGTRPVALRERELSTGAALDMAVALPYPVMSRRASRFLGAAELRVRPEFQLRREVFDPGLSTERIVERTMLLPLTAGVRWILSDRQRFTLYVGPRLDFVAFSEPGSSRMRRGGAASGPIYGEAWYDIDVPFTHRPRRDRRARRAAVNGQLNAGYVHSRFDGQGINVGPIVGFLGPVVVRWLTRVRPNGWPVALQGGVSATFGGGVSVGVRAGVVFPNIETRKGRRR